MNGAPVGLVGGFAAFLVVVDLGHGAAPVDDEVAARFVGHAGAAQVDVACGRAGAQAQADFGEVGLAHEQLGAVVLFDVDLVGSVVGIDFGVARLEFGGGFHHVFVVGEVERALFAHVAQLLGRFGFRFGDFAFELGSDAFELAVDLGKVLLLFFEYLVHNAP